MRCGVFSGSTPFAQVCSDTYGKYGTSNPLYTHTRYNDEICYNDTFTGTEPSLKRWQLIRNYTRTFVWYFKKLVLHICLTRLVEAIQTNAHNIIFCEKIRIKQCLHCILYIWLIKCFFFQQPIYFSGSIFGNKCCRYNEGLLYFKLFSGGTADITVHEKLKDGNLREVHRACGGPWGGTAVDKNFVELLSSIVGG